MGIIVVYYTNRVCTSLLVLDTPLSTYQLHRDLILNRDKVVLAMSFIGRVLTPLRIAPFMVWMSCTINKVPQQRVEKVDDGGVK